MSEITFFTAVTYPNQPKSLLEKIDDYFYFGGKKAHVIAGSANGRKENVLLSDGSSLYPTALKVISYFTIVIPLIALIFKVILRSQHQFNDITPKLASEPNKPGSIREFYEKKGITYKNQHQALEVDPKDLGLDLHEAGLSLHFSEERLLTEEKPVTMGDVVNDVIKAINKKVTNLYCSSSSPIGTRWVNLGISSGQDFQKYALLGTPKPASISEENKETLWLYRILDALVQKGHIFSFEKEEDRYFIQA